MVSWKRLGRIYDPCHYSLGSKLLTHAANPLAVAISTNTYRIYFSGRDEFNRSSVGAFDFDIKRMKVTRVHKQPIITHGYTGSYDASGISVGCRYTNDHGEFILYMAWQNEGKEHWRGDIGRLQIESNGALRRTSDGAYLVADETDPISLSYPAIIKRNDKFFMVYGTTIDWKTHNGEMLHILRSATSSDGETWNKHPDRAIPYAIGKAQAFSRPSLIHDNDGQLYCWFSFRDGSGRPYRIGFAKWSDENGWDWDVGSVNFAPSENQWDRNMVEYPFVFKHLEHVYMLYNGDGFGRTGIGLAKMIDRGLFT